MAVSMDCCELSPGVMAITFSGPLTLGDRLGEIDYALREMVRQALRRLVLDLSGRDFIDRCFGCLLRLYREERRKVSNRRRHGTARRRAIGARQAADGAIAGSNRGKALKRSPQLRPENAGPC